MHLLLYFPQIFKWTLSPERSHADRGLKYFRLLAESAVDMCRPFLYTVLVVSVFSQPQLTTKNEIGNPFRGSLSHFFVGAILQQPPTAARTPHAYNRFSDTPASAQERFSILWASWQCPPTPAGYALIRHLSYQWYWPGYPATAGCCCPWSWAFRQAHGL